MKLLMFVIAGALAVGQTAESIVQKHVDAIGGLTALKAVQSLRISGQLVMGGGQSEVPFQAVWKAPNRSWVQYSLQGQKVMEGFDGTAKWIQNPFLSPGAFPANLDDTAAATEETALFEDSLVNFKEKGSAIELVGREEGSFKIKVKLKSGHLQTVFVDATTYLVTKVDKPGQTSMVPGNFKTVAGIQIPTSVQVRLNGRVGMELQIDKTEVNAAVDDAIFQMPPPIPAQKL